MKTMLLVLLTAAVAAAEPAALALADGYATSRPRLLLDAAGVAGLAERAKGRPEMWLPVLAAAQRAAAAVPDAATVRDGKTYHRIDTLLAAAVAFRVTGEASHRDTAIAWMRNHAAVDVWGTGWRQNVDIPANWYMYYIALAYDLLYADIPAAERTAIATGLGAHAEAVYRQWRGESDMSYDQNHTYVPMVGLAAAALALLGEDERAPGWLAFADDMMRRCRSVLPADGWYYEGTGYWEYAFHWHVRYADLLARATGRPVHDLPMFRANHLFAAHLSLPGAPFVFDIGDTGKGAGHRDAKPRFGRKGFLYRLASVFHDPQIQGVADTLLARGGDWDDPAMQFLWYDPGVPSQPMSALPTSHRFDDFGVITWRSSWDADATVAMFRCGPPVGYAAEAAMARMPEWRPNTGHVHPDIGMFWLYAHGGYLATDTGYTGRKRTADHNTILVDGRGMGHDRSYWAMSGFPDLSIPYATWTGAKLENVRLEASYAYAVGDFSAVHGIPGLRLRRHFLTTRDATIVVDDLAGDAPHSYSSVLHADAAFTEIAPGVHRSEAGPARLLHYALDGDASIVATGPATVFSFVRPNEGQDEQRGFQLTCTSPQPVLRQRFLAVLLPLAAGSAEPQAVERVACDDARAVVRIRWTAERATTIAIDLAHGTVAVE